MKHYCEPTQAAKDAFTREGAFDGGGPSATTRTSSTSVKDTISPTSLIHVLYALAARRTFEAWRSP